MKKSTFRNLLCILSKKKVSLLWFRMGWALFSNNSGCRQGK